MGLVACGWLLGAPAAIPSDNEPSTLAPLTRSHPNSGLAESSGLRLEKPAQPHRSSIKKPELGGRPPRPSTVPSGIASALRRQPRWDFPRRHLAAARLAPRSPDDSADPFPS
jgi:hypothetical protein